MSVTRLTSRSEISSLLSRPTWSVSDLFSKDAASSDIHQAPTEEVLEKLLKQSALNSTKNDPERRDMLLKELKNQLTFVEHVASVDTTGIEPLVRFGAVAGGAQEFSLDKVKAELQENENEKWTPTDLAQQKNGKFYKLNEGLRRE